tara:strand:- start:209 stop:850 length:642 start_codon:yes stop_codon:yes gene_type:complete
LTNHIESQLTGYNPPAAFVEKLEEDPESFDFRMSMHLRRMKSMQAFNYIETVKDDIRKQSGEIYSRERFYSNTYNGVLMVYLPNKEYYKNVLKAFKDQIKECKGPWSTKHVDMLIDRDTDVAVRSKPYWGKYNIKVNARPNYNIRWDQRRAETEKLSLFFKDNTDPNLTRFQRTRYGDISFWTTDEELLSIKPFLELAHPKTRIHVTRCFITK